MSFKTLNYTLSDGLLVTGVRMRGDKLAVLSVTDLTSTVKVALNLETKEIASKQFAIIESDIVALIEAIKPPGVVVVVAKEKKEG